MPDRSKTPFEHWARGEGVPIIRGYYVASAFEVPVQPWPRRGGQGAIIVLEGGEGVDCAFLYELAPGETLKPHRQMFEESIYVLDGEGETRMWNDEQPAQTFSWQRYGLFGVPLNAWHEHRNTGSRPARLIGVGDAPMVLNYYRNPEFVFGSPDVFRDRYDGQPNYFDGIGEMVKHDTWEGGLIPDVRQPRLETPEAYGKGTTALRFKLSGATMEGHLAGFDAGTYKKAHRHNGGAHIIVYEGAGYALMWERWEDRIRADFQEGSIYVPPESWWHTHFNMGTEVTKHVALRLQHGALIGKEFQPRVALAEGGDMMERHDEPPQMREEFEAELRARGLASAMAGLS